MISKGFSVHIDGREKHYGKGQVVPAAIVDEFDLSARGLVEGAVDSLCGSPSTAPPKTKKSRN